MMFGFGRKKDKNPKKDAQKEDAPVLTPEEKEQILLSISSKEQELDQASEGEQAKILEEIGKAYSRLGDDDRAIAAFEKSIQIEKSVGDGYKKLLSLYNKKRAEAAKANDEESLQIYLDKMDRMMQVSKDVARGVR
ncbi:tetratricopeptide repeat protein [Terribacillus sp. 7520-G]|uniref:tetratricopeptide repeat protein n=1 Tax=Terribacillus TaxID=459532 RepID=UPI00117C7C24|nr:tetratricopeptide repeat protein [Terribacillus sp. 7520-G]